MNDLRARAPDLCMSDASPFQQHYEFRTTRPLKDVIHDKFFLPLKNQLYPGDSITICRFDILDTNNRLFSRLMEVAEVRVISGGIGAQTVPLLLRGEIAIVPAPVEEKPAAALKPAPGRQAA